jgi:putative holliday junction resolvase
MARLLAIDYGLKRIGIAVSDPSQIIASPLDVISPGELMNYLSDYIKQNEVEGFVLGYPSRLDSSDTHITAKVRNIAAELKKRFPSVQVHLHDERYTTTMAMNSMIEGGAKKKDRRDKKIIDKVSAAIILQSFMQQKSFGNG